MKKILAWMGLAACACMVSFASADAKPKEKPRKGKPADQAVLDLVADFVDDRHMRIDGNLEDWAGGASIAFETLLSGEYEYDWTGPNDLSATVKSRYSATKIYFLVQVKDNVVVNKLRQWGSDKVELWLRAEDKDGRSLGNLTGISFDIGPVVDGKKTGVKSLAGSNKLEFVSVAPYISQGGYDFEISVDFALLAKSSPAFDGTVRFCVLVRDWDQDDPNEDEATVGSCPINPKNPKSLKPSEMGRIRLNLGEKIWNTAMSGELSRYQGAWLKTSANVSGAPIHEVIGFSDDTLVVAGFDLGTPNLSWHTISLMTSPNSRPVSLTTRDIDGDKYDEIFLTRTEPCDESNMQAERVYVFKFANDSLQLLTNYVTEIRSDDGKVAKNSYKLSAKDIQQTLDAASSADISSCTLPSSGDMVPFIMPGEGDKKRTISF